MPKKRPAGDGMVRQKKRGQWEARIVVGHKDDGKPIYRYVYGKTQKEVLDKLHQRIEDYRGVELTEDSKMTLGEWLDKWLNEYMLFTIRESTWKAYETEVRLHIKPYLGDKQIAFVTTADVQKMYNKLKESGRVRNHPTMGHQLSDSMVRSIHMMLHEAMDYAMREHMILKNPTEGTTIPKAAEKEMQILSEEQIGTFMEAIKQEEIWRDFFYLELMTGLREGEICALKWSDFDAEAGKLAVSRTLHSDGTTGETKTYSGMRSIKLPESAAEMLRERKKTALTEWICLLYTSPSPRDRSVSRMPSSA